MDILSIQTHASNAATAVECVVNDAYAASAEGLPEDINEAYLDQAIRALTAIKEELSKTGAA